MRADWVYRGYEYDMTGNAASTQVASYVNMQRNALTYTLQPGTPVGVVLYDSHDYLGSPTKAFNAASGEQLMLGREARAEHGTVRIHAVEGTLYMQPSTWTAGSDFTVAARLVICEQNLLTGALALPANYTLLGATITGDGLGQDASDYANGWGNLQTRITQQAFSTENDMARFSLRFRWKGKRSLPQHLCLGLYVESAGPAIGSTTLRIAPQFRTLVTDSTG